MTSQIIIIFFFYHFLTWEKFYKYRTFMDPKIPSCHQFYTHLLWWRSVVDNAFWAAGEFVAAIPRVATGQNWRQGRAAPTFPGLNCKFPLRFQIFYAFSSHCKGGWGEGHSGFHTGPLSVKMASTKPKQKDGCGGQSGRWALPEIRNHSASRPWK